MSQNLRCIHCGIVLTEDNAFSQNECYNCNSDCDNHPEYYEDDAYDEDEEEYMEDDYARDMDSYNCGDDSDDYCDDDYGWDDDPISQGMYDDDPSPYN
jgi:hypothetical protein